MFETHKLNDQGFEKMARFKGNISAAVKTVLDLMPDGHEKSMFRTKIEEAVFFGAKAIASDEGNYTDIVSY